MTEPRDQLLARLAADPDADAIADGTDRRLSIGRDVVRLRWRSQLATAVAADAGLSTTTGALLDVLALRELSMRGALGPQLGGADLSAVHVLIDRDLPGTSPSETDEAVRSTRDAVKGTEVRVWYRQGDRWVEDTAMAPTWHVGDSKATGWVNDLLMRRLVARPHALATELVRLVDDPSLQLYPTSITPRTPDMWALRIDGLEIGTATPALARLTVGAKGSSGSQRQAFRQVFGRSSVTVGPGPGAGDLDLTDAAERIVALMTSFRGRAARGAPVMHRSKGGVPYLDEHALEARILKGLIDLPGTELIRDDTTVARGSQFPTLWGHAGRARYLDAMLRRGTTPVALELKVSTGGQGRYYRRGLAQAVLYRHFIHNAPALDPWFDAAGLDRGSTVALLGIPSVGPAGRARLDLLRALAERVEVEVVELALADDAGVSERDISNGHSDG